MKSKLNQLQEQIMQIPNQSYLKTYHEMVKNTFSPFAKNDYKILELLKRIGLVIIAPFAYIALAFGFGINSLWHWIKSRKINQIDKSQQNSSNFWKNITPKNIDTILNTEDKYMMKSKVGSLSLKKIKETRHNNEIYYNADLTLGRSVAIIDPIFSVKKNKFRVSNKVGYFGCIKNEKYSYFENLDGVLKYLNTVKYNEFRNQDFLIFTKANGEEVVYNNSSKK